MEEKDIMEMRTQIALLKEKLNQQDIVNDRLIRASMRDGKQLLNQHGKRETILGITCAATWFLIAYTGHSSVYLAMATALMMIFCIAATWYCHRPVNQANLYTDDIATVAQAFASVKHMYHIWITRIAPAMILPWLAWVCYDYNDHFYFGNHQWVVYVMVLGCATVGFLIGYNMQRKVVDKCQEIIDQLEAVK